MALTRLWLAGLVLFVLLSLTDFVQTYALITDGEGAVYEANPVADAWLRQHGWSGLALFKLGTVAVFTGAAAIIVIRRPRIGVGVIAGGCVTLLTVTLYSNRLLANADQTTKASRGDTTEQVRRLTPLPVAPHIGDADSEVGIPPPERRGAIALMPVEAE